MEARKAIIAWNPAAKTPCGELARSAGHGAVAVVPLGDPQNVLRGYAMTCGACFVENKKADDERVLTQVFVDFHTLVVRDGIDPQTAHKAFLKIDEYRAAISPDIKKD